MKTKKQILEKIIQELNNSSFRAYSDIQANEKYLHGNVGIVVYLENAKAIVKQVFAE